MAHITLNEGAVSVDAANWSDAAGFADNADMGIPFPVKVTTNLDRTADTTDTTGGIDSMSITGKGVVIGTPDNYLHYQQDPTPTSGITNLTVKYAEAWLEVDHLMVKAEFGIGCNVHMTATTITTVRQTGGTVLGNASTVFTNPTLKGGNMTLQTGGTAPTTFVADGGTALIERGGTTLTVSGGAIVTIDGRANAWTTVNIEPGGKVIHLSGAITTVNGSGGELDSSQLTAKYTIGTSNVESGFTHKKSPLLTVTTENLPDSGSGIIVAGGGSG